MGRVRGKGKKQFANAIAARDDNRSGEDEKLPVRKRGRPQKPLRDDLEEENDVEKIEHEEEDLDKKDSKILSNKRKRPLEVKANKLEENNVVTKTNTNESIKSVGYRQIGSRRKNKPRRAAEVGVECK